MLSSLLNVLLGPDEPDGKIYKVKEPEPVTIIVDSFESMREKQLSELKNKASVRLMSDAGLNNLSSDISCILMHINNRIVMRDFAANNNQDMIDLDVYLLEAKCRNWTTLTKKEGNIIRLTMYE